MLLPVSYRRRCLIRRLPRIGFLALVILYSVMWFVSMVCFRLSCLWDGGPPPAWHLSCFNLGFWLIEMQVHEPRQSSSTHNILPDQWPTAAISPGLRRLAIVLPADHSSHELCKVISSIIALGYPAPVIVNWNATPTVEDGNIGASQLQKITSTLNFLDWATGGRASSEFALDDGDLVMMLDAYDVWMQLPPSSPV